MIRKNRKCRVSLFLRTLRTMLNNENQQFICWGFDENSFKIKNPSRFTQQLLPKYFKHSNLASFIRQLNIYNFKKKTNEKYPDEYIYEHQYFIKNKSQLMKKIRRKVNHYEYQDSKDEESEENSNEFQSEHYAILEKKKILDEVNFLEKQLEEIKVLNSSLQQQKSNLQGFRQLIQKQNAQITKAMHNTLTNSYYLQYEKFLTEYKQQYLLLSSVLPLVKENEKGYRNYQNAINQPLKKNLIDEKSGYTSTNINSGSSKDSRSKYNRASNNSMNWNYKNQEKEINKGQENQKILEQNLHSNQKNQKSRNSIQAIKQDFSSPQNFNQNYLLQQHQFNNDIGLSREKGNQFKNISYQEAQPKTCVINLKLKPNQFQFGNDNLKKIILMNAKDQKN